MGSEMCIRDSENPDEFDSLATEAVLTMAYPALKAVKYLAKYGTKVALRVVDSARKLGVKTKEGIKDFSSTLSRLAGNEVGSIGNVGEILDSTKTVWSKISNTAETITGTNIPRRFNIDALGSKFHVHPNATKHMGTRVLSNSQSHGTSMYSQVVLAQFEKSISKAANSGKWKESVSGNKVIMSDGWELRFSKRDSDPLPVIMHAVFKGNK